MAIHLTEVTITEKVHAIIMAGIPSDSVHKWGTYYQCVIDPNMVSPGGAMIRFDQTFQGGEVHGWQRVNAITVCEILGTAAHYPKTPPDGYVAVEGATVTLRAVKSWAV